MGNYFARIEQKEISKLCHRRLGHDFVEARGDGRGIYASAL